MRELRRRLPGPMVPQHLRVLAEWPMTVNGKIDRDRLDFSSGRAVVELVAPAGRTEELVAEVWLGALSTEAVGRDSDFFALGGNSLAATRVAAELSDRLDRAIEPCHVMENPTVASLATVVDQVPARQPEPDVSEVLLAHVLSLTESREGVR